RWPRDWSSDVCSSDLFSVENVRRRADKHAAVPARHRCRPRQVIDVNRAFVEAAVAVGVLEEANPAEMGPLVPAFWIIAHLDDEQIGGAACRASGWVCV